MIIKKYLINRWSPFLSSTEKISVIEIIVPVVQVSPNQ